MEKSEKRKKKNKEKDEGGSVIDKLISRVTLGSEEVFNDHAAYPQQEQWSLDRFKEKFKIDIVNVEEETRGFYSSMEFDMIGIDTSLANAFRRIMLAEVPSMAIDKVLIYNNTSVIPDEVLAHRLGMIPFKADQRLFEMPAADFSKSKSAEEDSITKVDPRTTLVFKLCVKCKKNPKYKGSAADHNLDEMYIDHKVYSRHIEWISDPKKLIPGSDADFWSQFSADDVGPVDDKILLAKLRPGQEIDVELHCVKGIGKDHAKFQPVATAWYRLLPDIVLKKPVVGEQAHKLKACFPEGVIEIDNVSGNDVARVADARLDKASREVLRHDDLKDCVELSRVKDHFIYTVESIGALSANVIVTEAIDVLMEKCQTLLNETNQSGPSAMKI